MKGNEKAIDVFFIKGNEIEQTCFHALLEDIHTERIMYNMYSGGKGAERIMYRNQNKDTGTNPMSTSVWSMYSGGRGYKELQKSALNARTKGETQSIW